MPERGIFILIMNRRVEGKAQEIIYDPSIGFGCAEVIAGKQQKYISFVEAVFPNKNRLVVVLFEDETRTGRARPHLVEITGQTMINGRAVSLEARD